MLLITGATGLTGRYLLELLDRDETINNEEVICYVRPGSDVNVIKKKGFRLAYGEDITDLEALLEATKHVDTIIHIVQLRYAPIIVNVAKKNNVKRIIIVGTTGIFSKYQIYADEYRSAEKYIMENCTVPYVVIRPTMIYGDEKDKNMNRLLRFMKKYRFFPVFGSGKNKMQPIYYQDLGRVLYEVYRRPNIKNKFYNVAGKRPITYYELLKTATKTLGINVAVIKIPYWLAFCCVGLYNFLSRKPKIKLEQVRRLVEDKDFDYSEAAKDLNFDPVDFSEGIKKQVHSMFKTGSI